MADTALDLAVLLCALYSMSGPNAQIPGLLVLIATLITLGGTLLVGAAISVVQIDESMRQVTKRDE